MASADSDQAVRREVRDFYDSVGWQNVGEGLYQNARYEDLRPVSQDYIKRCRRRVRKSLPSSGRLLLDAGSGPIQYPEYLEYSDGFDRRVCLDISSKALAEARTRIGEHGMFVVGDIVNLPFADSAFDAVVSLHTVHHVPADLQVHTFNELYRVQHEGGKAVVVNTWGSHSVLMRLADQPMRLTIFLRKEIAKLRGRGERPKPITLSDQQSRSKTFTSHTSPSNLVRSLSHLPDLDVRVWRSVSTGFMRAFIDSRFFGRELLRFIYWSEEGAPHLIGRWGQYPMILFGKPAGGSNAVG